MSALSLQHWFWDSVHVFCETYHAVGYYVFQPQPCVLGQQEHKQLARLSKGEALFDWKNNPLLLWGWTVHQLQMFAN